MTQEFHVSVTPIGGDEYLVRTERVAPGVPLAEEQVTWPIDQWLAQASLLMNDPLIGVLRGDTLHLPNFGTASGTSDASGQPSANLVEFGQTLYNALFQKTMRDSWMTARGIAHHRQEILRLRLGLKDSRLPRLPWEVLHGGDRPLTTGTDVLFSRYHSRSAALTASLQFPGSAIAAADQPLRILMVLAAPTDQESLALKQEALHLQEELQSTRRSGSAGGRFPDIELTILEQPGREQLAQTLEHNHYQVFHYAGHSNLGASGGSLYLVSRKTGLTETLSGDDLAGLLVNNGIRMAVFNSCRGGYTATSEATGDSKEGNLVEALVKQGIPAVLAMAERIPDDVALNLSRLFYRNLKQGCSIDLSLNRARQGLIASYTSNQLYWALPILYLHPDFNGYLKPSTLDADDRPIEVALPDLPVSPFGLPDLDPFQAAEYEDAFFEIPEPDFFAAQNAQTSGSIVQLIDQLTQPTATVEEEPLPAPADENLLPEPSRTAPPYSSTAAARPAVPQSHAPSATVAAKAVQVYSELEQMLAEAGKLTEAIAACYHGIQMNPNDAEAYHRLGRALCEQGYLAEAITAYNQSIQLNPRSAEVHNHLGTALAEQGNLHQAILEYNQAIQLNPNLQEAHQNLAVAVYKQNAGSAATSSSGATSGSPAQAARSQAVPQPTPWFTKLTQRPLIWLGAGAIAVAALLGVWVIHDRGSSPVPSPSPELPQPETAGTDTNAVVREATEQLNQGNIDKAQRSIAALLDRNALSAASAVLNSAPGQVATNPAIVFLKGRLAWQYVRMGNPDYSIDDARRFLETAAKQQPNPTYQDALGFVYYEEGNFDRAGKAWYRSLELRGVEGPGGVKGATADKAALTAYAGIALTLMKSAEKQPPSRQPQFVSQAIQLRQKVMTADPTAFQVNELSQNWMWSEKAIKNWQALLATK